LNICVASLREILVDKSQGRESFDLLHELRVTIGVVRLGFRASGSGLDSLNSQSTGMSCLSGVDVIAMNGKFSQGGSDLIVIGIVVEFQLSI
jgi:hypothetical protein